MAPVPRAAATASRAADASGSCSACGLSLIVVFFSLSKAQQDLYVLPFVVGRRGRWSAGVARRSGRQALGEGARPRGHRQRRASRGRPARRRRGGGLVRRRAPAADSTSRACRPGRRPSWRRRRRRGRVAFWRRAFPRRRRAGRHGGRGALGAGRLGRCRTSSATSPCPTWRGRSRNSRSGPRPWAPTGWPRRASCSICGGTSPRCSTKSSSRPSFRVSGGVWVMPADDYEAVRRAAAGADPRHRQRPQVRCPPLRLPRPHPPARTGPRLRRPMTRPLGAAGPPDASSGDLAPRIPSLGARSLFGHDFLMFSRGASLRGPGPSAPAKWACPPSVPEGRRGGSGSRRDSDSRARRCAFELAAKMAGKRRCARAGQMAPRLLLIES